MHRRRRPPISRESTCAYRTNHLQDYTRWLGSADAGHAQRQRLLLSWRTKMRARETRGHQTRSTSRCGRARAQTEAHERPIVVTRPSLPRSLPPQIQTKIVRLHKSTSRDTAALHFSLAQGGLASIQVRRGIRPDGRDQTLTHNPRPLQHVPRLHAPIAGRMPGGRLKSGGASAVLDRERHGETEAGLIEGYPT